MSAATEREASTGRGVALIAERTLIRNGIVLTLDDALGELPRADVLIEGDMITQHANGPRWLVEASRNYLVSAFGEPEPGWLSASKQAEDGTSETLVEAAH